MSDRVFLSHADMLKSQVLRSHCVLFSHYYYMYYKGITLVECHSMKDTMWMLFLLNLQNFINAIIDIFRCFDLKEVKLYFLRYIKLTHRSCQIKHGFPRD